MKMFGTVKVKALPGFATDGLEKANSWLKSKKAPILPANAVIYATHAVPKTPGCSCGPLTGFFGTCDESYVMHRDTCKAKNVIFLEVDKVVETQPLNSGHSAGAQASEAREEASAEDLSKACRGKYVVLYGNNIDEPQLDWVKEE
eukprot:TRINITY_DN40224_c0_g1_i2.p5 TRINITY_DN40224_c0_g1~~TRINITY_DN40224_c0_g1_i2.p5  ORF type:complete len:145 (-),score=32.26 TRINITY_DN40224_c0_g1_i2:239-673(-)